MIFYCPNCRVEKDLEPTNKVITKTGRVAHKANCPTCNQDMTAFNKGELETPPTINTPPADNIGVPQPTV